MLGQVVGLGESFTMILLWLNLTKLVLTLLDPGNLRLGCELSKT